MLLSPFELGSQAEEENAELSGLPVLVVDDDQIICESAAEILDELGMRSSWVLSGKEAVCRVVDAHEAKDDFFLCDTGLEDAGNGRPGNTESDTKEVGHGCAHHCHFSL